MAHCFFDIYIDYSENLIGYNIIEKEKIKELLPKISKLKHYKMLKYKREYLNSMKKLFVKNKINLYLLKEKIKKTQNSLEIFVDVLEFVKKHNNCIIFISVDDNQYKTFKKVVKIIDGNKIIVKKESQLKRNTIEQKMSFIIDTKLNLQRRKEK